MSTLATTGANDYPSDRIHQPWVHYNMRLNNLIVEVNAGVGAKLKLVGQSLLVELLPLQRLEGVSMFNLGRDLISNIPINQSIVLDIFV